MAKWIVTISMTCEVEGSTLEDVKQIVDNAIDYSKLRKRGIDVVADAIEIVQSEDS